MDIPYPKRKFLLDDDGKDDKDKVSDVFSMLLFHSLPSLPQTEETAFPSK